MHRYARRRWFLDFVLLALVTTSCDRLVDPEPDPAPPEILLETPTADLISESDSMVVSGVVRGDRQVEGVSYRLNDGEVQVLPIVPANEIRIEFVLRDLAIGTHALELTASDAADGVTVARVEFRVVDVGAPRLSLEQPLEGAETVWDSVVVKGVAEDDHGVTRIAYRLNDDAEQEVPLDSVGKSVSFTFAVHGLREGTNELLVVAHDAAANADTVRREFTMSPGPLDPSRLRLREIATGLVRPLHLTSPAGDDRLFIVEQPGRIRVMDGQVLLATPFLDLTAEVTVSSEEGLLGLAFHPDYAENGYFYVYYSDQTRDTRVVRFRVSANPNVADAGSAKPILVIDQPPGDANHKAGTMFFGTDGLLYVASGDGSAGGDPHGNAQDPGTLLGAVLRIDVDGGDPYAIPADNPFVGQAGARGEVWAIGLRNPWRISIDRATGTVFVPDVGEDSWEEVNVVDPPQSGLNFGWPIMEGPDCFFRSPNCDKTAYTAPVLVYPHPEGCSIIGGHVYRGRRIPALRGHYVYSDFCQGFLRSFRYTNGQAVEQLEWSESPGRFVNAIGEDGNGELYVLMSVSGVGKVLILEPRP